MLRFNLLLPEERRYKRKKQTRGLLGIFALLLVIIGSGSYLCCLWQQNYYSQLLTQQKAELKVQREELLQTSSIIKGGTQKEAELAGLQQIAADLWQWQAMLTDVTEAAADLLWLTQMKTAAELEWGKPAAAMAVNSQNKPAANTEVPGKITSGESAAANTEVPGKTASGESAAANTEVPGKITSGESAAANTEVPGKITSGESAAANSEVPGKITSGESAAANSEVADKTASGESSPALSGTAAAVAEATDGTAAQYDSLLQNINRFLEIKEAEVPTALTAAAEAARAQYLLLQGQAQEANSIARYYSQLLKMPWFSEVRLVDGLLNEKAAGANSGLIEFRIWARLKNAGQAN